jgi:hypothetical protein
VTRQPAISFSISFQARFNRAGGRTSNVGKKWKNIMKWSWKAFGLQLVVTFLVALGLAYSISMIIDAKRGSEGPDSTLISMAIGGLIAPLILSLIAGWKRWILKSPLIVAFIVAALYASNPAVGILCVIISAVLYLAARKGGEVLAFYAPTKNDDSGPVE